MKRNILQKMLLRGLGTNKVESIAESLARDTDKTGVAKETKKRNFLKNIMTLKVKDAEEDVKSVTFYVCTLEDPHTCYKPETMDRNDSVNGRFQFTYEVKSNDYPGYKYELEKNDNSVEKIPASEYSYYEGMEVEKMEDSYYFKVNVKIENSNEDSSLPAFSFFSCLILITTISLLGRR